ncbi:MAG: PQQ-dependent sugar dehydrogenase [Microbacterium sp.]
MSVIRNGLAGVTLLALALAGCAAPPAPTTQEPSPPTESNAPNRVLATGLDAPWSVVPTGDGGALISQRDDGEVIELTARGELRTAGTVPDVVADGEAGLNGLALHAESGIRWLYAYHATADDNRVVRMPLEGDAGSLTLGPVETVFAGIPRARFHNGGRIAFGPDGMLYIGTGDAGDREGAQDRDYLGGKILRITPAGDPAPGNPFGTAVYSLGHRNVQGLAWTADGTMWASEFGQDSWDELNRIEAGGNYGWPLHEGIAHADGFIDPVVEWKPEEASPSGIAAIDGVVLVAGLRGQRLWVVGLDTPQDPWSLFVGEYGRLRDVVPGPNGSFWVLTNNTDGRGAPREGDDRLLQLTFPEG